MGRFGPDPQTFFKAVYAAAAPWEIGAPQSAMISLIERYPPASPALDLGCASGDLAIHLALLGCEVHGVDFVERAIEQANSKLTALPPDVANRLTFSVADAMRPSALGTTFSSIFDSGFLHLLDERESEVLVEELGNALRVGGRYYLHAFAVEFPIDNVPRAVTETELRERFNESTGWRILHVSDAEFTNTIAQATPAIIACIERIGK